ncbi:MAG: YwqG family protein [Ktedonobacteraceae bacterium]
MNKTDVQAAFQAAGLARLTKDIDALAKASIRLTTTPVTETTLEIGISKLGGVPDVPSDFVWPEWKGFPQSFIAQIRLEDAHPYDVDAMLPEQGMLWFFYDAQQQTFGADPADKGGWSVLFTNHTANLQRATVPTSLPATSQFQACTLYFSSEITLSLQPHLELVNFDWTDEEQQKYETFISTFPTPEDRAMTHNRILGNPETLQDDMRLQCEYASNGVTDSSDPKADELAKGALEWQLLLQVDSDEHAGMQWANTGLLYYWVKKTDLQVRHFNAIWLVLQSE